MYIYIYILYIYIYMAQGWRETTHKCFICILYVCTYIYLYTCYTHTYIYIYIYSRICHVANNPNPEGCGGSHHSLSLRSVSPGHQWTAGALEFWRWTAGKLGSTDWMIGWVWCYLFITIVGPNHWVDVNNLYPNNWWMLITIIYHYCLGSKNAPPIKSPGLWIQVGWHDW